MLCNRTLFGPLLGQSACFEHMSRWWRCNLVSELQTFTNDMHILPILGLMSLGKSSNRARLIAHDIITTVVGHHHDTKPLLWMRRVDPRKSREAAWGNCCYSGSFESMFVIWKKHTHQKAVTQDIKKAENFFNLCAMTPRYYLEVHWWHYHHRTKQHRSLGSK